jgi:hypothetical protein
VIIIASSTESAGFGAATAASAARGAAPMEDVDSLIGLS